MSTRCAQVAAGVVLLMLCAGCGRANERGRKLRALAQRDTAQAERLNEAGLTLIQTGEFAEAEGSFRQAIQADLFHGPSHSNLGLALSHLGKHYEAATEFYFASKLMPKASQPRANLGLLYESVGRFSAAEDELRAALRINPDDIEVIGHLARVHIRQAKRTPEVKQWLETLLVRDDDPKWKDWARRELIRMDSSDSSFPQGGE